MTRKQANQIIKANARGVLAEELEYLVDEYKDWDYLYALEHHDHSDWYNEDAAFRRGHRRLQRLIGIYEKVEESEEITIYSLGRTRVLKPGTWHCVKAYSEFI